MTSTYADTSRVYTLSREVVRALRHSGGASFDADTAEPMTCTYGYMVSLPNIGAEVSADADDAELAVAIQKFAVENADALAGRYLGAWLDNGTIYLDVSTRYTDRADAIAAGIIGRQIAIYDVAAGASIYLN